MMKAWETAEPKFGLGYLINAKDLVETGRKAGTGSGWGTSGTIAWLDPQSGIAVNSTFRISLCASTDSFYLVRTFYAGVRFS
jgi:hypothetical protein